jgi:hypothetical protein
MAVAFIFLMNLGRASWGAIFLAFNQDIAPGRVGAVAGVMGCIGAPAPARLAHRTDLEASAGIPFG